MPLYKDFSGTYPRNDRGIYIPAGWGEYWKAARTAATSTPATVAIVGDSIGQGFHSSNLQTLSWASLVRASLQSTYGDGGSGYFSSGNSIAAFATINTWPASNYLTVTGAWSVKGGTEGPGSISLFNQNSAGSTMTVGNVRGTTVTVYYMTDPAFPGSFTVTIDGVLQGTTPSNSQAAAVRSQAYTVAAGTHTVVITTVGASGLTCIFGVAGTNATGVIVNNFSYNGRASASYALSSATYGSSQAWSGGSSYPSDLYIYALGVNDSNTSVAADTYVSNVRRTLDSVKGAGTKHGKLDVLILANHIGTFDNATPLYHRYMLQMRGMAEAYNAAFVNLWALGRNSWDFSSDASYWGDGTSSGSAGSNTVHPGDTGHAAIANTLIPLLTA
jgi:lysophospholipase L1-like esterase